MTRTRTIALLVGPSLWSGMVCSILAVAIIAVVAWSYIESNGLFYDFLFGRFGIATAMLFLPSNTFTLGRDILNSSATYYCVVIIASIMIGVLVYELLQGVGRVSHEAKVIVEELRTRDPYLKETLYNDLTRLGVRLISLATWMVYCILFINVVWPFTVLLVQHGFTNINEHMYYGLFYLVMAMAFLAVSLHLHVTFLRLCTLRLRLFGL